MTGCADAVLAAVRHEVERRRASLDGGEDLGEVTVTVRLQAGTSWVRAVTWQEERVYRQHGRAPLRLKAVSDQLRP